MVNEVIQPLLADGRIRPLDAAFADFLYQQETVHPLLVSMLGCYLSLRLAAQDTCVETGDIAISSDETLARTGNAAASAFAPFYQFPQIDTLVAQLSECSSVTVINHEQGGQSVDTPIVVDHGRVYLQRYWVYETRLAQQILTRIQADNAADVGRFSDSASALLQRLFADRTDIETGQPDWQQIAVIVAACKRLSFITGGPGTGKTTTVAKLLALLSGIARQQGRKPLIKLVAPTGKAAARLSESMTSALTRLPADLSEGLPTQCSTIHRLLGVVPNQNTFRHHQDNPLHVDILVVDEASMIDLPLMCKLFDALPQDTHVIMLGDRQQLASVEAGSVLSDICAAANSEAEGGVRFSQTLCDLIKANTGVTLQSSATPTTLGDNMVTLRKSHRFSATSGVGKLASAINAGDMRGALSLMDDDDFADISLKRNAAPDDLVRMVLPGYQAYLQAVKEGNIGNAFIALQNQQVLCAQRNGDWGVHRVNTRIETELSRRGLITLESEYYVGRPLMLSENDHALKLFNGDVGIVMPDPEQPGLVKVWFMSTDGQFRGMLPSRLPPHETMYAMTIHKSQGSEFNHVYLSLPPAAQTGSGLAGLNRELLYTGLTRAKSTCTLFGDNETISRCITQRCIRSSGLAERLR